MSHDIEYTKKAYRAHSDKYNTDVFFAFLMHSANNVDPRTPHPYFVGIGQDWEIIQKVCGLAADCESGCLQPGGRRCRPESYIRRWREVLKNAPTLEQFVDSNPYLRLKLTMKRDALKAYLKSEPVIANPDKYRWDRISELLKGLPWNEHKFFDEEHVSVEIPVKSYADVQRAVELDGLLKEVSILCWNIEIQF
jgi:hypothetical protein